MKKIITLMAIFALCANSFAQLKVSPNGNIYLGTDTIISPQSRLSINGIGNSNYELFVNSTTKDGAYIKGGTGKTALHLYGSNESSHTAPVMKITANGIGGYYDEAYGIYCEMPVSNNGISYGIASKYVDVSGYTPRKSAAIFGGTSLSHNISHTGIFAGYFVGDVRVTGTLYGTLLTPSSSSNNISSLTDRSSSSETNTELVDGSVLEKFNRVQLLQTRTHQDSSSDTIIQTRMADVRYELATDQLKDVFPELVYEDADGNTSINYIEMVPLLVQSVNELTSDIEELRRENARLMSELSGEETESKSRTDATSISAMNDATDIISISQNDPNPFSDRTTITVNIPEGVNTAAVFFSDMSGKQIDKRIITERGQSQLSVNSSDMTEGMYLYSLIADGKVISTRKMILTK